MEMNLSANNPAGVNPLEHPLDVRVYPVADKGNLLAFASVELADRFVVCGIKVMSGENGTFVSMPRIRDMAGEYHDISSPATAAFRQRLDRAVLDSYQAAIDHPTVRRALHEQARAAAGRGVLEQ